MHKDEEFAGFHAHIYFNADQAEAAGQLAQNASQRFSLRLGRLHRKPIGPHPIGSIQLVLSNDKLAPLISWLIKERGALNIFIHPLSGDDMFDHTNGAIWIGRGYELNLSAL